MSVDDALALLGARAGAPRTADPATDAGPKSSRREPTPTADWRQAIREAGGEPEGPARLHAVEREESMPRRVDPKPTTRDAVPAGGDAVHVPATQFDQPKTSPLEDVPAGLVVGGASRAL